MATIHSSPSDSFALLNNDSHYAQVVTLFLSFLMVRSEGEFKDGTYFYGDLLVVIVPLHYHF